MTWFEVHAELCKHPKVRRLAKKLDADNCSAVGLLIDLWSWGIYNASKYGEILDADISDIKYVFAGDTKLPLDIIPQAMIETGWIDEREGRLAIHDWEVWQEQLYKAHEKRESDKKTKRELRLKAHLLSLSLVELKKEAKEKYGLDNTQGNNKEEVIKLIIESLKTTGYLNSKLDNEIPQDEDPVPSGGHVTTEEPVPPEKTKKQEYSKDFEVFWSEYPRKLGKGEAYKKYLARKKDGFSADELLIAAKNYAAACRKRGTEAEFIKHAKTFLSENTPFTDYIPKNEESIIATGVSTANPFEKYLEDE